VDSPPRERPSASRPAGAAGGFLLFASAPRGQSGGLGAAGAGRVLMGAHHRGIGAHRPSPYPRLITASLQLAKILAQVPSSDQRRCRL